MSDDRLTLRPQVRFRAVDEEGVIIHTERGVVIVVNALGLRTLELIREQGSRRAVIERLAAEYDAPEATIAADLDAFLGQIRVQQLIEAA
ncbi:MAG: PqqD family protein [Candidatus Contendobacter sp.]